MEQEENKAARSDTEAAGSDASDTRDHQIDDAERARHLEEEIRRLPVRDHLFLMMHSLSDLALIRLGLAGKADLGLDLDQARLAIDGFRALLGVVEKVGSSEEIAPRKAVLAQLQLAYAAAVRAKTGEDSGARPKDSPGRSTETGAAESRTES